MICIDDWMLMVGMSDPKYGYLNSKENAQFIINNKCEKIKYLVVSDYTLKNIEMKNYLISKIKNVNKIDMDNANNYDLYHQFEELIVEKTDKYWIKLIKFI